LAKGDCYKILGVTPTESLKGIRSAYRKLAKRLHPDCAGQEATRAFQDITEAYGVLSNAESRKCYDETLMEGESRPPRPAECAGESIRTHPRKTRLDEMLDQIRQRGFQEEDAMADLLNYGGGMPGRTYRRREIFPVEVILSSREAARGASVPLEVPAFEFCPHCRTDSRHGFLPCFHCGGEGFALIRRQVHVRFPPGVNDGSLWELPLADTARCELLLRLMVWVRDAS
jgi:molecular chaperone DnaJ